MHIWGKGRATGRVGSDFLSAIAGRVGSGRVNVSPGRVGSGPRKVTRGQLCLGIGPCPLGQKTIFFIYRKKERGFLTCESCFVNIYLRPLKLDNSIKILYPPICPAWHGYDSPA